MKPIRLSDHAMSYTAKRGFSVEEVHEAIQTTAWMPSEQGGNRLQCCKEFKFDGTWSGRKYSFKKVRPIFVELPFELLVITVYTYYYLN